MAFDGIVAKSIISELNTCLINGKINKIYQPNKNEILLGIYSNSENYSLNAVISPNNYRINLTKYSKQNPQNAPSFCMLLRKHLIGSRIKSIKMIGLERIINIELECYNELNDIIVKNLIIELMGKHSNIILTNQKNIIIDSLRHLDISTGSNRSVMPAREYVLPESNKIDIYSINNFEEFYFYTKEISNISIGIPDIFTGISKSFIVNAISFINIEDTTSKDNLNKLYFYLTDVLKNMDTTSNSCISLDNKDFTIIPIKNEEKLNINYFIDNFYFNKESSQTFFEYRNSILQLTSNILIKISKRLKNINSKLKECENMDIYRLYGELITANLYRFKDLELTRKDYIEIENYYDNNSIIQIPLNKEFSIQGNSKNYFKKYNKLKNTLEIVSVQKAETKQEINYIESIIYAIEKSKTINDINDIYSELSENKLFENLKKYKNKSISSISSKKYSFSSEPIKLEVSGYKVLIGKNNKQNDFITTHLAKKDDLWFHTKDIHGSHVVLFTNHSNPDIDVIIRCAEIAAYYSKASMSSNVDVDFTFVKNVKKPSKSRPGMVIYTKNETVTVKPKKY